MKIDRMIGILSILLQQDKVTAPYLAEKFEVSRRTIFRDIEDISRAGIPLVTMQGANGGVSIMEGYRVDRTLLTSADMQAILAGLRSLDSISGTNRYAILMEKISPGAADLLSGDQHILIDLSSWYKASLSPKIELIHSAIERTRLISFNYFSPRGETQRTAEPYYLIFQWASWYVWCWCSTRQDFRLFKLNRMTELKSGAEFEKRSVPMPNLTQENVFPAFYNIKALFLPEHKWRLVEEYGPASFEEQEDGRLLFSFGFTDKNSALTWILTFGGGAELLEPQELRAELLGFARELEQRYSQG